MTMDEPSLPPPPSALEFADQLIRQLLGDLDGILFDGEAAVDETFPLLAREAARGGARGAGLLILAQAAANAYRSLVDDAPDATEDGDAILAAWVPEARAQRAALGAHASSLERVLALAEQREAPMVAGLSHSIERFYRALEVEDEPLAQRILLELRSMVVHVDANAVAIEAGLQHPRRVLRPDRFHDWFMQYASLAQSPEAQSGERAVATLTEDGRISAVITEDTHPLEAAARTVRDLIPGDELTRDHALARIRALLDFIDRLRRRPLRPLGDVVNDQTVYLSLVIAAATAPLEASGDFSFTGLGQIARYNQTLLRGTRAASQLTH